MEAIHLCLKGKNFKNSKDEEMINFDSQYSNVFLNLEIENTSEEISIDIKRGSRKSYKVNNEEIKLIRDLKNQYKCVIFEQDMLKIIKEGPKNRRDFVEIYCPIVIVSGMSKRRCSPSNRMESYYLT